MTVWYEIWIGHEHGFLDWTLFSEDNESMKKVIAMDSPKPKLLYRFPAKSWEEAKATSERLRSKYIRTSYI